MVPFGGWLMPVQYTGIVDEHQSVRNAVGMFDISHMGQFVVSGNGARDWLNTMLTNNVAKLDVGQGQYTFLLNDDGGVIDDLIVYRTGDAEFLLVVNAAKVDEDLAWLEQHRANGIALKNRSADFGGVAIQGPRVVDLFHELLGQDVELPARNCIRDFVTENMPVTIARTGYTGEDGVEVFFRAQDAAKFGTSFWSAEKNSARSHVVWARATHCAWKCVIRSMAPIFRPNGIRLKPVSHFLSILRNASSPGATNCWKRKQVALGNGWSHSK